MLLRLVGQYADACNFTDSFDPGFYRHKLDVLRRHCDDVGRDYDEIAKTTLASRVDPLGDVDAWLTAMQAYADLGVEQVWTSPDRYDPVGWTERMGEQIVPRLSEIG